MIKARGEHGYSAILCCCQRNRYACNRQMTADSTTPTSISTITATIIPEASARASDSMINRPMPRSAPMNSPTMTPINAKEIAGDSEAKTHAMVDGITTVRVICHSLAPSSRAALTKPSSIERAPSNVLKNTRNTTTIQDVTIFDVSPIPNAKTMIGASAMRGIEFTAVMKGWKMSLSRSDRPSSRPTAKPDDTPMINPKNVFFSVIAVATQRLFSFRTMHLAKSPLNQPLKMPNLDFRQLRIRKCSKISDGFDTKYGSSRSGTSDGNRVCRSYPHCQIESTITQIAICHESVLARCRGVLIGCAP